MTRVTILPGDCTQTLDALDANSVDACVTDPPYHLTSIVKRFGGANAAPAKDRDGAFQRQSRGFMGKQWDGGDVAFRAETWDKVHRVMKPGAFLCAFSATRTYHRMACAIEDAGFIICDMLDWLYGSGFPKSVNIAHMLEKTLCVQREVDGQKLWFYATDGEAMRREPPYRHDDANVWHGYGTALKPAHEPIVLAQKPISERSIVANVQRWGTGALNIAGCLVMSDDWEAREYEHAKRLKPGADLTRTGGNYRADDETVSYIGKSLPGRWPANVLHDGSEDVDREFAAFSAPGAQGVVRGDEPSADNRNVYGAGLTRRPSQPRGDCGSPARFFYSAKADDTDRMGSSHPTVKPVDLMAWLVRLTTPAGGVVLDPFAGTGTTGQAALREGRRAILCERETEYLADIKRRIDHVEGADTPLFSGELPAQAIS